MSRFKHLSAIASKLQQLGPDKAAQWVDEELSTLQEIIDDLTAVIDADQQLARALDNAIVVSSDKNLKRMEFELELQIRKNKVLLGMLSEEIAERMEAQKELKGKSDSSLPDNLYDLTFAELQEMEKTRLIGILFILDWTTDINGNPKKSDIIKMIQKAQKK